MKYIIFTIIILIHSMFAFGQSYEEMMLLQKDLMKGKSNYAISIDQMAMKNNIIDQTLSYKTEIFGSKGRMFWKTPSISILQNERAYLMIKESEKLIMYKKFDQVIDLQVSMKLGMQEWDSSLEKFLKIAKDINCKIEGNNIVFYIKTNSKQIANAVIKFNKESNLMSSIGFDQIDHNDEVLRMEYSFEYNFEQRDSGIFNERKIVSSGINPKGIGSYKGYDVLLNTM